MDRVDRHLLRFRFQSRLEERTPEEKDCIEDQRQYPSGPTAKGYRRSFIDQSVNHHLYLCL